MTWARLAVGLSLLVAACSSRTLALPGGGADAGVPDGAGGNPGSGGFITGDVDGVTVRGETQAVAYWSQGLLQGWLIAEGSNAEWTWMLLIANQAGPGACSYGLLAPEGDTIRAFATYVLPDGRCDVTVTAPAPNVGDKLEGTFTATVVWRTTTKLVTNGAFSLPRIAEPPPTR